MSRRQFTGNMGHPIAEADVDVSGSAGNGGADLKGK